MTEGDLIVFREGFKPSPKITLTPEELSHERARRLNKNPHHLEIRDGFGKSYLYSFVPGIKHLTLVEERDLVRKQKEHSLAIALPKGNRLDFFLQKATEIGISKVYFCVFQHSIRKEFNLERAKKVVAEAASQSHQPDLLQMEVVDATDWIQKEQQNVIVMDPYSSTPFQVSDFVDKIPLIGPEGGFHPEEIKLMDGYKIRRVKWQGGILRTETAGIVAASLLAFGT
ncbi:MAG: RsmE family RNA methyltransferase [Leptospira sp.]|nr:RsmE family RNA methyltransferase [Leptospira sp.]